MNELEKLIKIYTLSNEMFEEYKNAAYIAITTGESPSNDKKLIIVGGQSGAGKSRVMSTAKKELNDNAIIVDYDELRSMHPYYKDVAKNYPEITHRILHGDTNKVKNKIIDELINNNYNVIYEGALRDTDGFIDLAKKFKDNGYKIKMDIMAVPKLESYGATFVRYATSLITGTTARWVEKSYHDASYEGVTKTVSEFYDQELIDEISIFVRMMDTPREIFCKKGTDAKEEALSKIEYGREIGRKDAVNNYNLELQIVKEILEKKDPERLPGLKAWENLYKEEVEYFEKLNKGEETK